MSTGQEQDRAHRREGQCRLRSKGVCRNLFALTECHTAGHSEWIRAALLPLVPTSARSQIGPIHLVVRQDRQ